MRSHSIETIEIKRTLDDLNIFYLYLQNEDASQPMTKFILNSDVSPNIHLS